jgi:hypothetical protein
MKISVRQLKQLIREQVEEMPLNSGAMEAAKAGGGKKLTMTQFFAKATNIEDGWKKAVEQYYTSAFAPLVGAKLVGLTYNNIPVTKATIVNWNYDDGDYEPGGRFRLMFQVKWVNPETKKVIDEQYYITNDTEIADWEGPRW